MKFFLDSDWCAIILSRPCSSCYGNLAVVMVSLFSQLSVMTHSARSAPNIAYRCYLLNFEKPLGKLRSWAWFQAFLCRLGAHQVVWVKSLLIIFIALRDDTVCPPFTALALHHTKTHCSVFELQPPVVLDYRNENYSACYHIECALCVLKPLPLQWKMNVPLVEKKKKNVACVFHIPRAAFLNVKSKAQIAGVCEFFKQAQVF